MKMELPPSAGCDPRARIGFVLPDLRGGGAERVMVTLAREFAALGYRPHFLLAKAQGELLHEVRAARYGVSDLGADRLRHMVGPLRAWLRSENPAALIPAMWPVTSLSVLAASGTGVPVITTDHATLSAQYRPKGWLHMALLRASIRATYPRAAANVSVSRGAAKDLEQLGWLSDGRVETIHNPVPRPVFSGPPAKWPNGRRHRLLAVGGLRWQKDYPTLLHAMRQLIDQGVDAELVVLGDGPDRSDLIATASRLGVEGHVCFAGYAQTPGAYYDSADLFVLSSKSEGFANVLVEALSYGLPVVSTDCPHGPAEILENGRHGALVPPGNAPELAKAIKDTLAAAPDPDAARQRARAFRPSVAATRLAAMVPALAGLQAGEDR
ncbi:glycosyltransferase [Aliiroseovarius marinus]|uniref:glycosyltransferase n=1 Tax=Aliiroseovarius marinus TaxID=2500159 RepID=UPI003D7D19C3